jgi:hypothetical protein
MNFIPLFENYLYVSTCFWEQLGSTNKAKWLQSSPAKGLGWFPHVLAESNFCPEPKKG